MIHNDKSIRVRGCGDRCNFSADGLPDDAKVRERCECSTQCERRVAQGDTQTVKGINGWEGEISGKPAPSSKFTKLQIGMSMKQVTDLIGQPNDQGSYITGKAWIPFYYGSDRYRHEMVYKSQGRLIFAGGSAGNYSSGHLTSIIHNAQESGYR